MGTNQIAVIGYVATGIFAMLGFSFLSGNFFMGFATGLMIIVGAGLFHEFTVRRDGFSKVVRGVIGLRETVDRADGAVTRMKADFEKTAGDARAAREALNKLQEMQKAAEDQLKALSEQVQEGGGETIGQMQQAMQQLNAQQQQTNEDIAIIQNAGNQLHGEFQAMQQQLAGLQQQMQEMQAQVQSSFQQVQATVNSMMAAGAAVSPAPPPAPEPAPPPAQPAVQEPAYAEAAAEAAPAAVTEAPPPPSPAPAVASAGGSDFVASVFQGLQGQLGALGDSAADAALLSVAEGLISDAVDLYVEPVVNLPERKPAFYECYGGVRGADGNALMIDPDLDMSGREPVMNAIENGLMLRCLERIEKLDVSAVERGKCFYNVPAVTLADRSFFGSLLGHLQNRPELANRLAMEFTQSGLMEHGEQAVEDLVQMQECGVSFSIDEITDLAIDFDSLVGFGFRFAKVGSKFIRTQANTADDPESVRNLAATLRGLGIDLIVENVETDLSLVELIAFEIAYGQGPLFGQPAVASL